MVIFWANKKYVIAFLAVLQMFFFSGCDAYYDANEYPYQKKGCWYCEEIDLTLDYRNGLRTVSNDGTHIKWHDKTLCVSVAYRADMFSIGLFPKEANEPISSELIGRWCYQDGNIVVIVEQDEIFGNAFEMLEFIRIE